MQVPVLGCTFLTLSDREESTAENRQLSQRGSAPIIRALMISATYLCPAVPPTCAHPPVPTSATHQCHPPVPTHQCCPPVPPTSAAQQCCQSVPQSVSSDASQ
ncbi:unnamed protein product, partial [Staurois parvus]